MQDRVAARPPEEPVTRPPPPKVAGALDDASLPQLIARLTEQTSRLVRDEVQLAKPELGPADE